MAKQLTAQTTTTTTTKNNGNKNKNKNNNKNNQPPSTVYCTCWHPTISLDWKLQPPRPVVPKKKKEQNKDRHHRHCDNQSLRKATSEQAREGEFVDSKME